MSASIEGQYLGERLDRIGEDARSIIEEAKRTKANLIVFRHELEGIQRLDIGTLRISGSRSYLQSLKSFMEEKRLLEQLPNQNLNRQSFLVRFDLEDVLNENNAED